MLVSLLGHFKVESLALVVQNLNTVSPATRIHFKLSTLSVFQYSVLMHKTGVV